ncbi:MAG TPA: lactate racemase domain-containing protein [Candidatus Bathyarchaeia archaeon]|nr:lactate racemase domain-containing protein [Candidatus Bathyarchaeia archaeon]
MFRIKQVFDTPAPLQDIPAAVRQTLSSLDLESRIKIGDTVAVTVGSRGIANIAVITKSVIDELKRIGGAPFIVPAMGSHGGATREGQIEVLKHLGVTKQSMGAPIRSSMKVVKVGELFGHPIYLDKIASGADHIAVLARIKPHTDFKAEIESGFHKMMLIGLGKRKGASLIHRLFARYGYCRVLQKGGREILKNAKIAFGLGIVENAYDQTAKIVGVLPNRMEHTEKILLRLAKAWMMKLPFDKIDVLIIDQMGKNISGAGMDPNVIGRFPQPFTQSFNTKIGRLVVLDMTDESCGNAVGIGRADLTTKKLVQKIDKRATRTNALTALMPALAKIPPCFDTDKETIAVALDSIVKRRTSVKVIRIKNTLQLGEIDVSEAYLPLVKKRKNLVTFDEVKPFHFNRHGNLMPFQFHENSH